MAARTVAICGIARDCRVQLTGLIPQIEALAALFQRHQIIVVENDSVDGTGKVLDAWSRDNPNVRSIRYCSLPGRAKPAIQPAGRSWFRHERIGRICNARNLYLAEWERAPTDYVIVADMDLHTFSLEGIVRSFARLSSWDAVASNGQRFTLRSPWRHAVYWDTYAYEPEDGYPNGVLRLADIRRAQHTLANRLRRAEWVPARSAFGGLCIYRSEFLTGARYSVAENADTTVPCLCEHTGLHRAIARNHPAFRLLISAEQRVAYETRIATVRRSLAGAFGTA